MSSWISWHRELVAWQFFFYSFNLFSFQDKGIMIALRWQPNYNTNAMNTRIIKKSFEILFSKGISV